MFQKLYIKYVYIPLAAILLFALLFGYGIYCLHWQGNFVRALSRVAPYPAVLVDWEAVSVYLYLDELRTLEQYWDAQRENPNVLLGIPSVGDIRERLVDKLIEEKIISIWARKNGIIISNQELEQEWLTLLARPNAHQEVAQFLDDAYGWSDEKFRKRVLYPYLLQQKVQLALAQEHGSDNASLEQRSQEIYGLMQEQGADFSALAREYSQDAATAKIGGSLGYFSRGTLEPQLEQRIFAMKIGQVSEPIKSSFGYHIFILDDLLYSDTGVATQASVRQILVKAFDFDEWLAQKKQETAVFRLVQ